MSIESLFDWFAGEVKWALFIALLVLLIVTAFKRAWIAMVGVVIGSCIYRYVYRETGLNHYTCRMADRIAQLRRLTMFHTCCKKTMESLMVELLLDSIVVFLKKHIGGELESTESHCMS
ncbi:hypothetical protein ACA29_02845 [Lederbergia galactosidilytica]|uniref:Uncharacterized protein n=1 Tax=Lederbergia galactosidilytica TaxID=217031 RepID=A0A0Q9YIG7_9BACI|nr:hypothetical protein ACA29_02845 [Lederbergia galactosidilytica]